MVPAPSAGGSLRVADLVATLNRLEESLGEDHNLVALRAYMARDPAHVIHRQHLARLNEASEQYQRRLRHDALALGVRVYARSPKAFIREPRGSAVKLKYDPRLGAMWDVASTR